MVQPSKPSSESASYSTMKNPYGDKEDKFWNSKRNHIIIGSIVATILTIVLLTATHFNLSGHQIILDHEFSKTLVNVDDTIIANVLEHIQQQKDSYIRDASKTHFHWSARGNGYLYKHRRMALVATISDPYLLDKANITQTKGIRKILIHNVWPKHQPEYHGKYSGIRNDCNELAIWIRVSGPEIFAGSAMPMVANNDHCYWQFPFDLRTPGDYQVDAKVLVWNGHAAAPNKDANDINIHQITSNTQVINHQDSSIIENTNGTNSSNTITSDENDNLIFSDTDNNPTNAADSTESSTMNKPTTRNLKKKVPTVPYRKYAKSEAFAVDMRFDIDSNYPPENICLEICSRNKLCQYWSTPKASTIGDGCEFYFDKEATSTSFTLNDITDAEDAQNTGHADKTTHTNTHLTLKDLPYLSNTTHHGKPYRPVSYYVGCGYSFWLSIASPCLNSNDDDIYMETTKFQFEIRKDQEQKVEKEKKRAKTIKKKEPEEESEDDLPYCTIENEMPASTYDNQAYNNNDETNVYSHGRWIREHIACGNTKHYETYKDSIPRGIYPDMKSYDNIYDPLDITEHSGTNPHCWHRTNLTDLAARVGGVDSNDISSSIASPPSNLGDKGIWSGAWHNYDCQYIEFPAAEIRECTQIASIGTVEIVGGNDNVFTYYLRQYLAKAFQSGSSRTWNGGETGATVYIHTFDILKLLSLGMNNDEIRDHVFQNITGINVTNVEDEYHFFLSPFYMSSEILPHVHISRAEDIYYDIMGNIDNQQLLISKGYKPLNVLDMSAAFAYDTSYQGDGIHILGPPMKMLVVKFLHHLCAALLEYI